jgi:trigger factor
MQVSVEMTSELSRKMTVIVPEALVQEKVSQRLKSLAREVKIDGFRPGKVPAQVVKKMYGEQARHEVSGDLINSTFYKALEEQNINPVGRPLIEEIDQADGFKYTAVFEVYPEISLAAATQLEVVRPIASVADSDVDDMIEKLRVQKQDWLIVDRAAQTLDRVTTGFTGISEDENFTDGRIEDFKVICGEKKMIPGFEENLIGLKAGDNKVFSITFPEDYNHEKLAGKVAEFNVDITSVEEPVLPTIDEAFIAAYGISGGTVELFRADIKNNMDRELEQALRGKLKISVMNELYEKIQVTLPNALIDAEVENLLKPYIETAKRQKTNLDELNIPRDAFEEQAKRRVALGLILSEVVQKNSIEINNDKVLTTIENMAKSYERPEDVVSWYYSDEKRLDDVRQMVLEDQVIEWLVAQAKVTDETVKFSDVMDQR